MQVFCLVAHRDMPSILLPGTQSAAPRLRNPRDGSRLPWAPLDGTHSLLLPRDQVTQKHAQQMALGMAASTESSAYTVGVHSDSVASQEPTASQIRAVASSDAIMAELELPIQPVPRLSGSEYTVVYTVIEAREREVQLLFSFLSSSQYLRGTVADFRPMPQEALRLARGKLARILARLRGHTTVAVELIRRWQDSQRATRLLSSPHEHPPLCWLGQDYLLKMATDLAHLPIPVRCCQGQAQSPLLSPACAVDAEPRALRMPRRRSRPTRCFLAGGVHQRITPNLPSYTPPPSKPIEMISSPISGDEVQSRGRTPRHRSHPHHSLPPWPTNRRGRRPHRLACSPLPPLGRPLP